MLCISPLLTEICILPFCIMYLVLCIATRKNKIKRKLNKMQCISI